MEQNFSTVCFSPHSENISKRGMIMAYVFFKAETWISQFATQRVEMVLFEMQKTALVQAPSATPGLSGWTRAGYTEPHPCIPMCFLLVLNCCPESHHGGDCCCHLGSRPV